MERVVIDLEPDVVASLRELADRTGSTLEDEVAAAASDRIESAKGEPSWASVLGLARSMKPLDNGAYLIRAFDTVRRASGGLELDLGERNFSERPSPFEDEGS